MAKLTPKTRERKNTNMRNVRKNHYRTYSIKIIRNIMNNFKSIHYKIQIKCTNLLDNIINQTDITRNLDLYICILLQMLNL